MNILFLCSRNQWRSPTAEALYRKDPRLSVRSAGTSSSARRTITGQDLLWADLVFVMEGKHKERIRERFPLESRSPTIHTLEIEDLYKAMDPQLMRELQEAIDPVLAEFF